MDMIKEQDQGEQQVENELQAVKELPEEEECDGTTTRYTTGHKMRVPNRNKLFCYSFQERGGLHIQHAKCISTKLEAKELDDDDNVRFRTTPLRNARSNLMSNLPNSLSLPAIRKPLPHNPYATPTKQASEDTSAVLSFIQKSNSKEPGDDAINYIIDSHEELVANNMSGGRNNWSVFQRKGRFTQSLILPHTSDDPAVDSEECEETKENRCASTTV